MKKKKKTINVHIFYKYKQIYYRHNYKYTQVMLFFIDDTRGMYLIHVLTSIHVFDYPNWRCS